MKWSLQQLKKLNTFPYAFSTSYDFKKEMKILDDVYDIDIVIVEGKIIRIDEESYQFDYHIKTRVEMACSLTLEPVDFYLDENFTDIYSTKENEDWFIIEKNTVSLDEMVWSNIVMSLPIRIVRDDAYQILKDRGIEIE